MDEKIIFITGSSRSIGLYLAKYFLGRGWQVLGCSRSPSVLADKGYRHYRLDVSDEEGVKGVFSDILREYGVLSVLINNAAVYSANPVLLTPGRSMAEVLRVNCIGAFLCSREAAKIMKRSKNGNIVNLTSISVPLASQGNAVYSASKAALEQFTRVFAKEVFADGIRVNALTLSVVSDSGMAVNINETMVAQTVKGAGGSTLSMEEVSRAVSKLISEEYASFSGKTFAAWEM